MGSGTPHSTAGTRFTEDPTWGKLTTRASWRASKALSRAIWEAWRAWSTSGSGRTNGTTSRCQSVNLTACHCRGLGKNLTWRQNYVEEVFRRHLRQCSGNPRDPAEVAPRLFLPRTARLQLQRPGCLLQTRSPVKKADSKARTLLTRASPPQ